MSLKVSKPKQLEWQDFNKYSNFIAEPKYDGERVFLKIKDGKITLHREETNVKNANYPEIVESATNLPDCILDGEMCVLTNDYKAEFEKILNRQTKDPLKVSILRKELPVSYMLFDILQYEDSKLENEPLKTRREYLNKIPDSSNIKKIKQFQPNELFSMVKQYDMEGIVLKDPNAVYKNAGFKFKNYVESDFKVVGFTSDKKLISSLDLEDFEGNYVGRVNWSKYPCTEEWAKKVVGMTAVVQHFWTNTRKVRFPVLKELRRS